MERCKNLRLHGVKETQDEVTVSEVLSQWGLRCQRSEVELSPAVDAVLLGNNEAMDTSRSMSQDPGILHQDLCMETRTSRFYKVLGISSKRDRKA